MDCWWEGRKHFRGLRRVMGIQCSACNLPFTVIQDFTSPVRKPVLASEGFISWFMSWLCFSFEEETYLLETNTWPSGTGQIYTCTHPHTGFKSTLYCWSLSKYGPIHYLKIVLHSLCRGRACLCISFVNSCHNHYISQLQGEQIKTTAWITRQS